MKFAEEVPQIKVVTRTLTQAQAQDVFNAPFQIVAGQAGRILVPLRLTYEQAIVVAYASTPTYNLTYTGKAPGVLNLISNFTMTETVVSRRMQLSVHQNAGTSSLSPPYPTGVGLSFISTSAIVGAGSMSLARLTLTYYSIVGN
jgi:hypothetical protein